MRRPSFVPFMAILIAVFFTFGLSFAGAGETDDGKPCRVNEHAPSGSPSPRTPGSLTTLFASDNGYAGNTFDILPSLDLEITGIDINVDALGITSNVDVYFKPGTCVGFENNASAWTLIGSYSGTGAGPDNPTYIDMAGNGVTFLGGQAYGIYIDLTSYGPADGMNYTNGGPATYANNDLAIVTNSGQPYPTFGSPYLHRKWNGTLYYDTSGQAPPVLDITCNGLESGVVLSDTQNARIDVGILARDGAGIPVDIWIVLNSPFGMLSYDGNGPISGWHLGLSHAHSTGPLADLNATVLDRPLPIGGSGVYKAHLAIDTIANGILNTGALYSQEEVDIRVLPLAGFTEDFDDGVADDWIDDGGHWSVSNNLYFLDCPFFSKFIAFYALFDYDDFSYTAGMRMVDTGNTSDFYDRGVIFRSDGTLDNGYELFMRNNGTVALYLHTAGTGTQLYTHQSPNLMQGVGSWNTVSVDARGADIDVFVNGVLDFTVTDGTWVSGKVGLFGEGSGTYNHDIEFDNVTLIL